MCVEFTFEIIVIAIVDPYALRDELTYLLATRQKQYSYRSKIARIDSDVCVTAL